MLINNKKAIVWDLECFPDFFSAGFITMKGKKIVFEVSSRKDERNKMFAFTHKRLKNDYAVVGFNSMGFDYPLYHKAFELRHLPVDQFNAQMKAHTNHLIRPGSKWWENSIREGQQAFYNVDLFLIHHFDNQARSTSLKDIAFLMERNNIRDLPYDPNEPLLTDRKMDDVLAYQMDEDCEVTLQFLKESAGAFPLREKYSKELGIDMINFNDTKMGKKYTEEKIKEATGDEWFFWKDGKKNKTVRPMLRFGDAILPSIQFNHNPALKAVLEFFRGFSTPVTKECFKDYPVADMGDLGQYVLNKKKQLKRLGKVFPERVENITIDFKGIPITFGTGGIHASLDGCYTIPNADELEEDIDVTSYYPSEIIEDEIAPAHIGSVFHQVYAAMKDTRVGIKHSPEQHHQDESAMLKLALNGTYGDMKNQWGVFFDPLALLKVTLNGQFRLCMLAESLAYHPEISKNFTLVQMNTDGMTFKYNKEHKSFVREVVSAWEKETRMDMEYARYSGMWIRDVNNYIARYHDDLGDLFGYQPNQGLKLKGCYEWDIYTPKKKVWNKNASNRASAYAAVQYMTQGVPVEETLRNYPWPYHFFIRAKVPRTNKLLLDGVNQQHISRIYISKTGGKLTKLMPPLPKKPDKWREQVFQGTGGWLVKTCNRTNKLDMGDIDMDYYIKAAKDLITPMMVRV